MSRVDDLRAAVTGLIGLAAAAEQMLMADAGSWPGSAAPSGSPQRWAAGPVIAHNTEFRPPAGTAAAGRPLRPGATGVRRG
jgi:hypothetical protein